MSTEIQKTESRPPTIKAFLEQDMVKQKFAELIGKRATSFITSVLQIVASNELLKNADKNSIYHSAVVAATLDLPLNNNLGFAYIVPYKQKQKDGSYKNVAQFQMGYKGYIQLAQRTGLFKTISGTPIYEGQLVEENPLTGFVFDFTKKTSDKIIGYAAYFSLLNGFEKTMFATVAEVTKHGTKYSQTFKKGFGLWKDDFDSMALKTVIKLLLSKYAPLSIEMQKANIADQSIIKDSDTMNVEYADNIEVIDLSENNATKEGQRITGFINSIKNADMLMEAETELFGVELSDEHQDLLEAKRTQYGKV
ncbi:MAG TPA: recombinase RecT [Saprospiraceae bacterium]|nr:recombinase RecT [Saprospiraceae bacterium]